MLLVFVQKELIQVKPLVNGPTKDRLEKVFKSGSTYTHFYKHLIDNINYKYEFYNL